MLSAAAINCKAELQPVGDDVTGVLLADCGHIVPLDRPAELLAAMRQFWR